MEYSILGLLEARDDTLVSLLPQGEHWLDADFAAVAPLELERRARTAASTSMHLLRALEGSLSFTLEQYDQLTRHLRILQEEAVLSNEMAHAVSSLLQVLSLLRQHATIAEASESFRATLLTSQQARQATFHALRADLSSIERR